MSVALSLAPRLAIARLKGSKGSSLLDLYSVIAFTVTTLLALTVSGGTYMFIRWNELGNPEMMANLGLTSLEEAKGFTTVYVVLAGIACALVVVPILSLGGAAARLGARGRSTRLASLRLIGMTGTEVVSISVVETVVQALVGMVLGTALWLLTLPLWGFVSFQTVRLSPKEMLGPWWLWISVWAILLVLAVLSTVFGLRRVRISPLGVASYQTPPSLKKWRLVLFVFVGLAAILLVTNMGSVIGGDMIAVAAVIGGTIAVLMLVINLLGPWVIQLIARMRSKTSSVPVLLASRRLSDDPKAAWRNVSSLAVIGFVAAFSLMMPAAPGSTGDVDLSQYMITSDLRTGMVITLGIALSVGAVSTLISQSSSVVDRASEARSLDRMGMERRVFASVRRIQVLLPLLVTLGVSVGFGLLMTVPFMGATGQPNPWMLIGVCAAGIGLSLLAAEACRPVQSAVLDEAVRRND